jgi:protease-4
MDDQIQQPEQTNQRQDFPVKPEKPMNFVKTFLASLLGFFAGIFGLTLLSGLAFSILIGSLTSGAEADKTVLDNSILKLELRGEIPEFAYGASFQDLFSDFGVTTLRDYEEALRRAANDDRIRGVWLDFKGLRISPSDVEALHRAIDEFKASGKKVLAISGTTGYSEGEYLVATAADSLFVPFSGFVEYNGSFIMLEFYKPLLDKLHIEPIMVRAGTYKSAVEPFTRDRASEHSVEALQDVIDGQYDRLRQLVMGARGLSEAELDSLVASYPVLRAPQALKSGLVDKMIYEDDIDSVVKVALYDGDADRTLRTVSARDYLSATSDDAKGDDKIAIVYAVGSIATGKSKYVPSPFFGGQVLGSESFVKELRKAREDDDVKAVVIRIKSPGGGLPASMAMWREISLTAARKPVVASMGSVAASGGYYIAAPAREIVAESTTITGSIGVFAIAFNMDGFFEKTIGINTQVLKTAPHADILSGMRNLTPDEMEFAKTEIDSAYHQFLQVVADGRNMSIDAVDSIAQGRIWTGAEARDNGLVDRIGGLDLAVERAAALADITQYGISVYPKPKNPFEMFMEMIGQNPIDMKSQNLLMLREQVKDGIDRISGPQARLFGVRYE